MQWYQLNFFSFLQITELSKFCQIFAKKLATLHGNRIKGLDYVQSVYILVLWLNEHSVEITIITLMLTNVLKNFVKLTWIKYWLVFTKYFSFESKFLGFSTLWCSKTRNTWKKSREIIFDSWFHEIFQLNRQNMTFT